MANFSFEFCVKGNADINVNTREISLTDVDTRMSMNGEWDQALVNESVTGLMNGIMTIMDKAPEFLDGLVKAKAQNSKCEDDRYERRMVFEDARAETKRKAEDDRYGRRMFEGDRAKKTESHTEVQE